jgi:hypothetical protein
LSTPLENDDKTTSSGRDMVTTTSSSEANNREESKNYFMRVKPPKINYSTIIIKPPSKGGVEEGKKESLSNKAKVVKESIERGLHIDNRGAEILSQNHPTLQIYHSTPLSLIIINYDLLSLIWCLMINQENQEKALRKPCRKIILLKRRHGRPYGL